MVCTKLCFIKSRLEAYSPKKAWHILDFQIFYMCTLGTPDKDGNFQFFNNIREQTTQEITVGSCWKHDYAHLRDIFSRKFYASELVSEKSVRQALFLSATSKVLSAERKN
jgi:hypothetical protein